MGGLTRLQREFPLAGRAAPVEEQVPTRRAVFFRWKSTFCSVTSKPDLVAFLQFYLESFLQIGLGDVSLFSGPSQLKPDAS
jgi:hypothetical protein